MGSYYSDKNRAAFPKRLVDLRYSMDLSQDELAIKIGETRNSIAKWETGISTPSLSSIVNLARFYHTTTDFLLKGVRTEQTDIFLTTGLSGEAIEALGRFKERDTSGKLSAALSKALSCDDVLNCITNLMSLDTGEAGYFDSCVHTPSEKYYECKLSPDSYAAYLSARLTLVINALRTGSDPALPPYAPYISELQSVTDELQQSGRIPTEGDAEHGK